MSGPEQRIQPVLYILIGVLALLAFFIVGPLWAFIFAGLLVGYLGRPIFRFVHRQGHRRDVSAVVALGSILVLVLVPAGYLGFRLTQEARALFRTLTAREANRWVETLAETSQSVLGWPAVIPDHTPGEALIAELVPQLRQTLLAWLPSAATFLAEFAVGMTVAVFISYYALRDGHRLIRFVEDLLPLPAATERRILDDIARSLDAVVFGQVLTAVFQGVLAGVGFWIFGLPSPVLLGFLSAVLSLLPILGPPVIWLPAALYLLLSGATGRGIGLLLWGGILVSTLDNLLKPWLMSERSGMHPTVALVGVLGGLVGFGLMGFVVGPVVLTLLITVLQIYIESREDSTAAQPPSEGPPVDPGDASGPRSPANQGP